MSKLRHYNQYINTMKIFLVFLLCLSKVLAESIAPRQTFQGIEGIRLVGGHSPLSGRVEVMSRGVWGTICDHYFGPTDAKVVCRSLGLPINASSPISNVFFGPAPHQAPILLDEVNCRGYETSLNECRHAPIGEHDCQHREDVGVTCARMGIEAIRLVGGETNRLGRLEIMQYGLWGTVCGDIFHTEAATVVCRSLGFTNQTGLIINSPSPFGRASHQTPILLDDVSCSGTELSLNECRHRAIGSHNCNHDEDVSVSCGGGRGIEAIRLVGSHTERAGRLEVMAYGVWGTVCDDFFSDNDARVICRSLGFPNNTGHVIPTRYRSYPFGQPSENTPIHLSNVNCDGTEATINDCPELSIGTHQCNHGEDVNVFCGAPVRIEAIRLTGGRSEREGRLEVMSEGVWGTVCQEFFSTNITRVVCHALGFTNTNGHIINSPSPFGRAANETALLLNEVACLGNETSLNECEHNYISQHGCTHDEDVGIRCRALGRIEAARLVGGRTEREGILEVMSEGVWGTVCKHLFVDNHLDPNLARVVCRSLGYPTVSNLASITFFDPVDPATPIMLDGVRCHGNESSINECPHRPIGEHNCRHNQDFAMVCGPSIPIVDHVRLVSGLNPQEGRLEVSVNGTWGTVCSNRFTNSAARVVCRVLGFPASGAVEVRSSHFGEGTGPIHLDRIRCTGDEVHLNHCLFDIINNCHHYHDVGVRCG